MDSDITAKLKCFSKITIIFGNGVIHRLRMQDIDNVLWLVDDDVFDIISICIHGKEFLRHFKFHPKYREQSYFETSVLCDRLQKLTIGQSDEIFGL